MATGMSQVRSPQAQMKLRLASAPVSLDLPHPHPFQLSLCPLREFVLLPSLSLHSERPPACSVAA